MTDFESACTELTAWLNNIKPADAALRANSSAKLIERDNAVSIRGSTAEQKQQTQQQNHQQKLDNDSSNDYSSGSDHEQDQHTAQTASSVLLSASSSLSSLACSTSPPRSILKISTIHSDDEDIAADKKKHVRFLDEVEAARKEAEKIKRKQERRQKQVEMHLAQGAADKKKSVGGKKKASLRNYNGVLPQAVTVVGTSPAAMPSSVPKKSGSINVQGVDQGEDLLEEISTSAFVNSTETTFIGSSNATSNPVQIPGRKQQRIKSYDYRSWDKFDVDRELENIDNKQSERLTGTSATRINSSNENSAVQMFDTDQLVFEDDIVATSLADIEKNKGNEAYKIKEYNDAVSFPMILSA
ncbi:hypothetical protein HK100_001387 [Physocladia obscura]|uniref:Uncharacterized protein n=1 Tax=Physocladia obscura TaxID=109957 RepID=A0AAD5XMV0_9FUNG|nr:hypothetical protein HK100_001387 [Physocladia obscura]